MPAPPKPATAAFARFAWAALAFTIAVVLWGAFVRATGSGAGCGAHWPLCNGEMVPRSPRMETLIELTHRLTSGVSLLLVIGVWVWARRAFPAGHRVRHAALAALLLMLSEALIGAGLVLFGLVADDRSTVRAAVLAVHLTNTFLLLAALALTAYLAGTTTSPESRRWRTDGLAAWSIASLAAVLVVGVTGAVTALGDTLFPAESLQHGLTQDFAAGAHFLVRLRVWHPVLALLTSLVLVLFAQAQRRRFASAVGRLPSAVTACVSLQLLAGAANVMLLAPVWLQLVHLALADLTWVTLVVLSAAALDAETSEPVTYS
jgi:heme A synthase